MIQNKLKLIEDTVCWVNEEEALFKFPQSSYQDVGDITVRAMIKWKFPNSWGDGLSFNEADELSVWDIRI